mgnify:FL=1
MNTQLVPNIIHAVIYTLIQELAITNCREQEIRAPAKKWLMQNKPVNTLAVYKDWLYGGSVVVEGSTIKVH